MGLGNVLLLLISVLVALLSFLTYNFLNFQVPSFVHDIPEDFILNVDGTNTPNLENAIKILSETLTFDTTTGGDPSNFVDSVSFLRNSFPLVNEHLEFREFELGVMFYWKGQNEELDKEPIVLLSHLDTVPVPEENLDKWDFPPYSGWISEEGYIYGRGALDTKSSLVGSLQAVEELLRTGFEPQRSVYLCFGFDEEIVDEEFGAKNMSNSLQEKGIEPFIVLDEGGYISKRSAFFESFAIFGNVARIGVGEKQFLGLNFSVECEGGHGSVPNMPSSCIYRLGRAVQRLIDHPMKSHVRDNEAVSSFIKHVFPNSRSFITRFLFSSVLTKIFPHFVIDSIISSNPRMNAMIRTTFAPTIIQGGFYENTLPKQSWMVVNVRIHPGDTLEGVLEHIRKTVNDQVVHVEVMKFEGFRQLAESSQHLQFEMIVRTIRAVFGDDIYHTPELLPFTTDLKHYRKLTKNCYNFWPLVLDDEMNDWGRIHNINERISIEGYKKMVQFIILFIKNFSS